MGKERMIPGDWRGCREGGTVLVEVESPWRGWRRAVMVIVSRHSAMYENTRHFPHIYQDNYMVKEMIRESRRRTPALLDAYATGRGLRIVWPDLSYSINYVGV